MSKYDKIKKLYPTLLLSVLLSFAIPGKAKAQVIINGYLYQGQELAELEYYLGSIPPGRYWLDVNTGYWGYEGNSQIQGNILQQNTGNSTTATPTYDPYSPLPGSYVPDPETGCSYLSVGDMTINTCENW